MSNYGQTSYETPYSGKVPPGPPGDSLSDTFDNTRPEWVDTLGSGAVVPGFAALQAKWLAWNPHGDSAEATGRVNTRTQRAEYDAQGKFLSGYFQQIPCPDTVGQTEELHIYAQCMLANPQGATPGGDIPAIVVGALIADDLLTAPLTSSAVLAGPSFLQQNAGYIASGLGGAVFEFVSYDALPNQGALLEGLPSYVRFRLRQTKSGANEWTTDLAVDMSTDGACWFGVQYYPQVVGSVPRRSAGFAVWCSTDCSAQLQLGQWIVTRQAFDDLSSSIGGVQQLGAV
jgi:hypothetical protein